MSVIANKISSNAFTYNSDLHAFYAEVSGLNGFNFLSQVFDDACDVGFAIESAKTGKSVVFIFTKTDKNDDEILGWRFESYNFHQKLTCLIIND